MASVGVVGLNYWGPNLVRNFDELGEIVGMLGFPELAQYYKSEVRAHAGR